MADWMVCRKAVPWAAKLVEHSEKSRAARTAARKVVYWDARLANLKALTRAASMADRSAEMSVQTTESQLGSQWVAHSAWTKAVPWGHQSERCWAEWKAEQMAAS